MSAQNAQKLSTEYQQLQQDLQKIIETRGKLDAQYSENESVEKEFNLLTPNNTIYKLIGTALVKQDHTEAKANVKKRLEFIQNEIKRVETNINEVQGKSEQIKGQLVQMQIEAQERQQAGQAAV